MKSSLKFGAAALALTLLSSALVPAAKAGDNVLYETGIWKIKIDGSGLNTGKVFLRKNSNTSMCKMWVTSYTKAAEFAACALSKGVGSDIADDLEDALKNAL